MRHSIRAALTALVLLAPSPGAAQNIFKNVGSDVKHGAGDLLGVWGAPFHASKRGYAIGAASLGVWALSTLADDDVAQWIRTHQDSHELSAVKAWREDSPLSLVNSGSGNWYYKGALAIWGVGLVARSQSLRDVGMGCGVAAQAEGLPRGLMYISVSRERPLFVDTIAGEPVERPGRPYKIEFPGNKSTWYDNSFFGGHNANVVACVSFITARFHLGYAEPVLWAYAAGLSLGRMADQRHYTSDVVLGVLAGYATGKIVGDRSRKRAQRRLTENVEGPADSGGPSWLDGVYVSRNGPATLIGWHTPR